MPQTKQIPNIRPNYDGTYNSLYPNGDKPSEAIEVTITGEDFGEAPEVILYRRFFDYEIGAKGILTPGDGEIGTFKDSTMTVGQINGIKCLFGFDGTETQLFATFETLPFQKFDFSVELGVPQSRYMPGHLSFSGYESFSGDSGWKPVWFLHSDGANSNTSKADLCAPTHIGHGAFSISGNSINTGQRFWDYGTQPQDHWDWEGWNNFNYTQDCDLDNPLTGVVGQTSTFISAKVGGTKATGVEIKNFDAAGFRAPVDPVLEENASYSMIRFNSYARNNALAPELTQSAFTSIYLAINAKNRVCIGNSDVLTDCTRLVPLVADSWTDTEVKVTVRPEDLLWATHCYVRKPDMTYTDAVEIK